MTFFREPPPTSLDIKYTIADIPVRIHPLFWLLPIAFGLGAGSVSLILIWVLVVFFSILIHEYGHAITFRLFGLNASIVMYLFGGLAIPGFPRHGGRIDLSPAKRIIISLAGPFAGFLLAGITIAIVMASGGIVYMATLFDIIPLPQAIIPGGRELNYAVNALLWINIFWGLINLMPVIPLDGGQVSLQLFMYFDPGGGIRNALWLSVITGAALAVAGFTLMNSIYMAFLFGMLAFQSFQAVNGRSGSLF